MIEERTMAEELEAVRGAYVQEVCERYDELTALADVDRLNELAYIAHDVLPYGQELAALFVANYSLLANNDLLTVAFNLKDWGLDPGDCTTIAAIRYTLTRFLISEVGGGQLLPPPRATIWPPSTGVRGQTPTTSALQTPPSPAQSRRNVGRAWPKTAPSIP